MRNILLLLVGFGLLPFISLAQSPADIKTPFEEKGPNYSASYLETMDFWKRLSDASPKVRLESFENGTDAGQPLHLIIVAGDGKSFHPAQSRRLDKRIVMINNGIHPGEPCGIDASMALVRNLISDSKYDNLLEHITLAIIPVYNVGGSLNRGPYSRANQNGPSEHGFRGNARLLDLNRDFIKTDSRNAQTFLRIFSHWQPDIFIDTHTSNGADYPYTMTYIPTQRNKLDPGLAKYMDETMNPYLVNALLENNLEMVPYVQTLGWQMPPDSGLVGFLETPRYSTGLAALYNTIGYTTEAHMLKPYADRVQGTYEFLLNLLIVTNRDRKVIARLRKDAVDAVKSQENFVIEWELERKPTQQIEFKGYTPVMQTSEVTGMPRLIYDRDKPWRRMIPYYNTYIPMTRVQKPYAYIVPQGWAGVIDRLTWAGVKLQPLTAVTEIEVEAYRIESFDPPKAPYEGHWPLNNPQLSMSMEKIVYQPGDFVVVCNQPVNRYIVETLEPKAHDSFFKWNFFDEILQQKEYFSPYVFEATARQLLADDPKLKADFQAAVASDSTLMNNDYMQMNWIYQHSPYHEPTHMRYPVGRLMQKTNLPVGK